MSVAAEPITLPGDDHPSQVVATFTDVTEARAAHQALLESEARYRRLAEHVEDVIWTMDAATLRFTYISPSILRLRGYTPEEAMAERPEDTMAPESLALLSRRMGLIGEEGGLGPPRGASSLTDVYEQRCKDGTTKHVEITITAELDEDGRLVSFLGVSRDVTARVLAEREREQTLAELREALRTVKTLSGLLPICMYCKKIRTDEGYWDRIETYIAHHTDALFSHSLCPDCYRVHVPADLQEDDAGGG